MGKSLQPQKATALRQPANTPAAAGPAAVPASNEPATAESLGWQLRAALPPMRLHSVSIWDEQGNNLWLSEGALGPDEHNVVLEAVEALSSDAASNCYETGIEYGPAAIFLPVRSPVGGLVGLAMILADIKSVNDGVLEKLTAPQIRTILQRVAVLLRPVQRTSQTESLKVLDLPPVDDEEFAPAPLSAAGTPSQAGAKAALPISSLAGTTAPPKLAAAPGPSRPAPPVLSAQAVDDILEFELTPDVQPAAPVSQTQRLRALPSVNNGGDLNFDPPALKPAAAKASPTGTLSPAAMAAAAPVSIAAAPIRPVAPVVSAARPSQAGADRAKNSPAHTPSLAEAVDLHLPELDAPSVEAASAAPVADNVTPFPVAAVAPVAVPVAASAAPTVAPAAAPSTSTTMTSRTLTGSTKALSSSESSKSASATSTSKVLAMPDGANLILEVLPFSKLRAGGRTRRFEVLPRSTQPNRVPPGFDKIALQQLLAWMGSNRAAWSLEPTSFTLNLSISTLEDDRFPQFVASNLKANGIAPDNIGFEIAEPLCIQRRAQVERFITLCDKLGCFVVIDDFSLDSSITNLLRSRALRLVKIDPKLTSVALKDKLAQAMVVAIAQAVKVLGIHCSAKRVDTQASLQWLTAIGADFAQGAALSQVQALESIGTQPAAPTPSQPA
jgi:EAL domain-containing protein (putative c-di-GMP-specific phosphodiesterase class I)